MPWVRFTDNYLAHDKIMPLSPMARLLDMCGIVYSARELRDGHLSETDVRAVAAMAHIPTPQRWAAELVGARRWDTESDGFGIHDYLDYQPSRDHVLAERDAGAERKRRQREAAGRDANGRFSHAESPAGHPPDSERSPTVPVPGPGPVPGSPYGTPGAPPQTPPQAAGVESGALPPPPRGKPRDNGTNPRATGANPRAQSSNPRATGTNPRRRGQFEFNDENAPRYEQRVGADGKREWVEVES